MSNSSKIILYQGALNQGRGLEAAIRAMKFLDGAELWIAGDGDITEQLKLMVAELKLDQKVKFLGRLPLAELSQITRKADLGISLEEDLGLNYRFALPNKLFDYIQAGVPVLVSNLRKMRKIVEQDRMGAIAETHQRKELAETMKRALLIRRKLQNGNKTFNWLPANCAGKTKKKFCKKSICHLNSCSGNQEKRTN
jgi:glycosyltransferase involved in cell wall biosynthesis